MSPLEYQYVLVRQDLPPEHQCCQAIHAATEAFKRHSDPEIEHPNLVVLHIPDERALLEWRLKIAENNIPCYLFQESDMNNEYTALATGLISGDQRKIFKKLRLLKFNK